MATILPSFYDALMISFAQKRRLNRLPSQKLFFKAVDIFSEYYKRAAGIPFMDSFLQELNTRFSADNRALKSLMSLVPLVIVRLADAESLAEELLFWEKDLPFPHALKVTYSLFALVDGLLILILNNLIIMV